MVPFSLSRIRGGSIKGNMVPFSLSRIREGSIKDNMVPFSLSLDNGFPGLMVWNMLADDVEGICDGKTKYPLMNTVLQTIY
jgi:hypothetical protein